MDAVAIKEYCWGCGEPIFAGEDFIWAEDARNDWLTEHPYHPECVPDTATENSWEIG